MNELIYTDHLSTFGVFHVKNEGQRSAKITNIYADISGIDQQEATETLRKYVVAAQTEEAAGPKRASPAITVMSGMAGATGDVGFATDFTGTI